MPFCACASEIPTAFVYTHGLPPRRLFDQATAYLELDQGPLTKCHLPGHPRTLMNILVTPKAIRSRTSHGLHFQDYGSDSGPIRQELTLHLSIDEHLPALAKTFIIKLWPDFVDAIRAFLRTMKEGHLASFGVLFPDKVARRLGLWEDVPYMQLHDPFPSKGKGKADESESSSLDVFADPTCPVISTSEEPNHILWLEPRVNHPSPEKDSTTKLVQGKQGVAEKGIFQPKRGQPLSKSQVNVRALGLGAVIEKGSGEAEIKEAWICYGPFLLL